MGPYLDLIAPMLQNSEVPACVGNLSDNQPAVTHMTAEYLHGLIRPLPTSFSFLYPSCVVTILSPETPAIN